MNRIASLLCIVALPGMFLGCSPSNDNKHHHQAAPADADGDGLSDADEAAFGTDPALADTDGDGLLDIDEFNLGTDGTLIDTDSDTYSDFDEFTVGTDPLDPESRIYIGYWPYNASKDSIKDPGWDGGHRSGDTLPRFAWTDQFGDTVDIYDFAHQGKYVVLDLSGMWCYWCNELAAWLDGQGSDFDSMLGASYQDIPEWITEGKFYYVTAIDGNRRGGAASEATVDAWYGEYPNEAIPVLLDRDQQLMTWGAVVGYPTLILMDENMAITEYNRQDYTRVLTELVDLFGGEEE
jgi:hypothetical protein